MSGEQVLLSGTGGQGLILAAIMLAEAAVLAGHNVVQSQSYGPEARGGASKAEVIISDEKIYYPKVQTPGLVLAMSQEAYRKYGLNLDEAAILVVDSTYVLEVKPRQKNFYALPITRLTRSELGGEQSANVMALGVVAALGNLLTREQVTQAVLNRAPKGTAKRNLKALEIGWQLGREAELPAGNRNAG
ncbi:Pyruvate-flavodoxin oxidoreductase, central domain protein [Acididesulfobacillus acetoxydans]|uniref:2-oxoacid:ferredoxin oxidoreductase, gamma subunit n=1 Tax=Acididesulfobacillus acetoxydans TaxID=1561005 RepID=A0A8S0X589_9FIRM|nr:2-oxoacid:acceptor oxidoreductase family protein [Acididesulfobacillus acetoxydans]CAA7601440.1 Pyruvate-flavodoxin oxidoreductase, central domain protein [Acididesulfobacillus acetoxydans]CEJ08871.1 2-oxoacid:ferredoxin oxidoreductase, gamma subunit [Acididesulfobacillus acetoxydans]